MKCKFVGAVGCWLLTLFTVNQLHAQKTGLTTLPDVTVTSKTNVNKKVANVFKANFKDARDVRWMKLNKDFLVQFITEDITNRVLFHKNGQIVYHLKYGHENNLPDEVRKLVKSHYRDTDFKIISAVNIFQDRRNIWVVTLENSKKYLIVRVEDWEIEEESNIIKDVGLN